MPVAFEEVKMSKKKLFRISLLAVSSFVLVAAIIVLIISLSSMGYKKAVKSYCQSLFTADFDTYWDYLSSLDYYGVDFESRYEVLDLMNQLPYDSNIALISSAIQSKTGEIKNISVEYDSVEKLTKDEIEKIYNTFVPYKDSAVTKLDDLKSARRVDIRVIVEGEDDTITFNISDLVVFKEGKTQRVFSLESRSDIAEKVMS